MPIDMQKVNKFLLEDYKVKSGIKAEEVRNQLDPTALIQSMLALAEEANFVPIDDIPRLKFQSEIYTTLLKKCMPDLRTLEVKENDSKYKTLIIEMNDPNK